MRLSTRTLMGLGVFLLLLTLSHSAAGQSKHIAVCVKVEAEGGGKGQGMWARAAMDLTPRELKALETLVVAEFQKQEGVRIVPSDYPEFISIVVVAAKLPNGNAGRWYIASSVVNMATKKRNRRVRDTQRGRGIRPCITGSQHRLPVRKRKVHGNFRALEVEAGRKRMPCHVRAALNQWAIQWRR